MRSEQNNVWKTRQNVNCYVDCAAVAAAARWLLLLLMNYDKTK